MLYVDQAIEHFWKQLPFIRTLIGHTHIGYLAVLELHQGLGVEPQAHSSTACLAQVNFNAFGGRIAATPVAHSVFKNPQTRLSKIKNVKKWRWVLHPPHSGIEAVPLPTPHFLAVSF